MNIGKSDCLFSQNKCIWCPIFSIFTSFNRIRFVQT